MLLKQYTSKKSYAKIKLSDNNYQLIIVLLVNLDKFNGLSTSNTYSRR